MSEKVRHFISSHYILCPMTKARKEIPLEGRVPISIVSMFILLGRRKLSLMIFILQRNADLK